MGPGAPGRVRVTLATPELLVTAITLDPENIFFPLPDATFVSDPALVMKNTLAPPADPPDEPGAMVTARLIGSTVPAVPVWPSPPVFASEAAGFPTTIQPLCVVETLALSVAGTENE